MVKIQQYGYIVFGTQLEVQQSFFYSKKHPLRLSTNRMLAYFRELSISLHWIFYLLVSIPFLMNENFKFFLRPNIRYCLSHNMLSQ